MRARSTHLDDGGVQCIPLRSEEIFCQKCTVIGLNSPHFEGCSRLRSENSARQIHDVNQQDAGRQLAHVEAMLIL
jgi:hypothetical protein